MNKLKTLKDYNLTGKNVVLRVDINVPIEKGIVKDNTRIQAIIPTIKYLLQKQAKVILISHFGRPDGKRIKEMSLEQIVPSIERLLNKKIFFVDDCVGEKVKKMIEKTNFGEVILLENLRFYNEETKNDPKFSKALSELGDLYVNDAFSCSHRAHSSIVGIAEILPNCAGMLMEKEINNLENLLKNPKKPILAIVGGSKVSTKIDLLNSLIKKADSIFIAGAMANTFLYALKNNVGKSLCEKNLENLALKIIQNAKQNNCQIILPKDVVVCKKLENQSDYQNIDISNVEEDDIIADVGEKTINYLEKQIDNFRTILWNGPLGAFEIKPFDQATNNLATIIARKTKEKNLISIAGGGDVISALNSSGFIDSFTYISTAGGAFLEWLEGKNLPGVKILF